MKNNTNGNHSRSIQVEMSDDHLVRKDQSGLSKRSESLISRGLSSLKIKQHFDPEKYYKLRPALAKAFAGINGDTIQDRVDAFIDKLNERYTLEQLEQLEPYLVRFVNEYVLPES